MRLLCVYWIGLDSRWIYFFERRSFTFCASLAILCAFLGGEPTFQLTLEYKLALERPFQMTFTVIKSRNSPQRRIQYMNSRMK